jgi:lysophospholipase L1-like esterase
MLLRFRADVIDLKPKAVVILAGTNDLAIYSMDDIFANLKTMTELARYHGIRVVLSSILPVHNYTQRAKPFFALRPMEMIEALNSQLKTYCLSGACTYLDYFSAMIDAHGLLKAALAEDGLHPNNHGYAVMMPLAEKAIEEATTAH